MKIYTNVDELHAAVRIAKRITRGRLPLEILGCVAIRLQDENTVTLQATNLTTAVDVLVKARVETDEDTLDAAVVPADQLERFLRLQPKDAVVTIETGNNWNVKLECESTRITLKGFDPQGHPITPIPEAFTGPNLMIYAARLKIALGHTVFCAADSSARPILTGVQIVSNGEVVTLVAADGCRLAVHQEGFFATNNDNNKLFPSTIVPAESLGEVMRALGDDGTVEITLNREGESATRISFWMPEARTHIVSQLITGTYPAWEDILRDARTPDADTTSMHIAVNMLADALRREIVFAKDTSNSLTLWRVSGNELVIDGRGPFGQAADRIKLDNVGPPTDPTFALNGVWVREFLGTLAGEEAHKVVITGGDPVSPIIITPAEQPNGQSYTFLIMPLEIPKPAAYMRAEG